MRRVVVIVTALAVLATAVSAYAASGGFNTYTANLKFSPNKAGKASAPAALGFTQKYVANGTNGNRTAPLTDITTKIYGLVSNGKAFPTCSLTTIANAHSDAGCPSGALVATGAITAILGPSDPTQQSTSNPQQVPCNPLLHVWNGGKGKLVFFFVTQPPAHTCGPIVTGAVAPFQGTVKTVGKTLVQDTPIPSYVSFPITGIEGSLTSETLSWKNLTKKVKGKTVAYNSSVACKKGKRPYSVTYTAELGGQSQSDTVTGTQKCK